MGEISRVGDGVFLSLSDLLTPSIQYGTVARGGSRMHGNTAY